jgi:hypothetical protein
MSLSMALRALFLAVCLFVLAHRQSSAQTYTTEDTRAAITQAADAHGVSEGFLQCIVFRESTYRPYAVGNHGEQGAVQLYPGGVRMRDFYSRGYASPWNPYEALDYLAQAILEGYGPHWSGWRACIAR